MSKKKPVYVEIPVGYVCVKLDDLLHNQCVLDARDHETAYIRHELYKAQDQVEDLKKQLSDANEKVSSLEKELNEKQDSTMYWYHLYNDLAEKLKAVQINAEAEKT